MPCYYTVQTTGIHRVAEKTLENLNDAWFAHKDATYSAAAVGGGGAIIGSGSVYLSLSASAQVKVLDKVGWKNQASGGYESSSESTDIGGGQSIQRKPASGLGATTADAGRPVDDPPDLTIRQIERLRCTDGLNQGEPT